jgi:hypothetical protein
MRATLPSVLTFLAILGFSTLAADDLSLSSGNSHLIAHQDASSYNLVLQNDLLTPAIPLPIRALGIVVNDTSLEGNYTSLKNAGGHLMASGTLTSPHGTHFIFQDDYHPLAQGAWQLDRTVTIAQPNPNDLYFNSVFRLESTRTQVITETEVFVPSIWYRTNFISNPHGALATHPEDQDFIFREDRLPLPLVVLRDPQNGNTLSLLHAEANPTTFTSDTGVARVIDERLQFGALGISRHTTTSLTFLFPGSEGQRNHVQRSASNRWAWRSHPVKAGIRHQYQLVFQTTQTASYPAAVAQTWTAAFDRYHPQVRPVNLETAYQGLIATLDHYAVGATQGYDAPGFPFSIKLPEGTVRAYNYESGFIGRQIPNAYYLLREGLKQHRGPWIKKGSDILDFWATQSLLPDGLPRTWYDPSTQPQQHGTWRHQDNPRGGTALRTACTGMEGLLAAWKTSAQNGITKPTWLASCVAFGDWLVAQQNADGSYYLAYDHALTKGVHQPRDASKTTTTNSIRFLCQLHQATHQLAYLQAAQRAGEYAYKTSHLPYAYVGSVIDNPNVIDRESGQEALYAFLALYDATHEARWLEAAVQAAHYTETWMYAYEVPATEGTPSVGFPSDRSIVGQTIIASGQSGADLGLAFSAFEYYRLYLFTGDSHFLKIAELLLHNTKQALNWDGSLYPEQPRGLQLEAFTVTLPRRRGVMECLSWNFAAHLDPLVRFQIQFGDFNLDALEKLPLSQRQELNQSR